MGFKVHRIGRILVSAVGSALVTLAVLPLGTGGATVYRVRLNTSEFTGTARLLAFDWISAGSPLNFARVANFATDAKRGPSVVQGGPISGGLVDGGGPLAATLLDSSFYNQLLIPLDSTGTLVAFDVGTSESAAAAEQMPEELSFFFLSPDETFPFQTVDRLDANALFAIDVTGQSGGDLSVFAPMQFVPPDTLQMINSTVAVAPGETLRNWLRFKSVAPNPSIGRVHLVYQVPEPGGMLRMRVFDVAGRLVAEPFFGGRAAGTWTAEWDAMDSSGRAVPAGVYIVQLQMAGQSLVRRVALTR